MSTSAHPSAHLGQTSIAIEPIGRHSRLSWGSVFAGLTVATAVQLVLSMLGAAVGLAAWDPNDSARGFGIGAGLWALGSTIVSLFLGGVVTGRLAGVLTGKDGFLHALLLWAVFLLFSTWLISSGVGALAGGAFRAAVDVAGATAGGAARGATASAGADGDGLDLGNIQNELRTLLAQTRDPALSAESLAATGRAAADSLATSPQDNASVIDEIGRLVQDRAQNLDRNDVINVITARTGRSRADAERIADRVMALRTQASTRVDSLQAQAGAVAEDAAGATAWGLWMALLAGGLSLGATVLGTSRTARE
jgi:hypothetical protein